MDQPPPASLPMRQLPFPAHTQPVLPAPASMSAHPADPVPNPDHHPATAADLPQSQASAHAGMHLLLGLKRGLPDPSLQNSNQSLGISVQSFASGSEAPSRSSGYQFTYPSHNGSELPRPPTVSQPPTVSSDSSDSQKHFSQPQPVGYNNHTYGFNQNVVAESNVDSSLRMPVNSGQYMGVNESIPKATFDFSCGLENSGVQNHLRLPEPAALSLPSANTASSKEMPELLDRLNQPSVHPQISPSREKTHENTKPLNVSNVSNQSLNDNASAEVDSAADMYAESGQAIVFEPSVQKCPLWNSDKSKLYNIELKPAVDRGFFMADDEWTCYRRNYFQISSIFTISESSESGSSSNEVPLLTDINSILTGPYHIEVNKNLMPINCFLTHVTAHTTTFPPSQVLKSEPVELVQHLAKRNKAPLTQPVPRFSEAGSSVVFDRLQFRTATNNTTRKKSNAGAPVSQQFFAISVEILAKLETGEFYRVCECKMEKGVVVRGRAPVHYQHDPPIEHPTTKRAAAIKAAKKVEENVAALREPSPILEEEIQRPAASGVPGLGMHVGFPVQQKFSQPQQQQQSYGMYSQQSQQAYGQGMPFQSQQSLYMQYSQPSERRQYSGMQSQQSQHQQSRPYPSYTQYPFLGSQQSFSSSGGSIGSQSMGYGMMNQPTQQMPSQNAYYSSSGIQSLFQPLPQSLPQPRSDHQLQSQYDQTLPQSSAPRPQLQQQSGLYGQAISSTSFGQTYQNQSHQLLQRSTGGMQSQPQSQQQQPMYSTNNLFQPAATPQQGYSSYLSSTVQGVDGSGNGIPPTQQLYHQQQQQQLQNSKAMTGIGNTSVYNSGVSTAGFDKPDMRNGGNHVPAAYSAQLQQPQKRPVRDATAESDDEYYDEGEDEDEEYAPRSKKR